MPKQELSSSYKCVLILLLTFIGLQLNGYAQNKDFSDINDLRLAVDNYKAARISKSQAVGKVIRILFSESNGESVLKCANPLLNDLHIEADELFKTGGASSKAAGSNPVISDVYLSPSGKFTIDYTRTGSDSVRSTDLNSNGIPDYVERAGLELDFSWNKQVQELGFKDPIPTNSPYQIRLRNTGSQVYGYTSNNGSLIVIHSTFKNFPSNTDPEGNVIGALKATIAHELKHAIQYRYNQLSGESFNWVEMDATLHEEVVYDEVNDYYNYLTSSDSYYRSLGNNSSPGSYEDVSFSLFFHEKYGSLFWTAVWERIPTQTTNFREALSLELLSRGSSLENEMNEIALWHFYSGSRTRSGYGFDEAVNYPNIKLQTTLLGSLSQFQSIQSLNPFSFKVVALSGKNANGFINAGLEINGPSQPFSLVKNSNNSPKEVLHIEGEELYLNQTDESWSSNDTLFFILSNGSRTSSMTYRILNSTDANSGIALWGDVDQSNVFNKLDALTVLQSVLSDSPFSGVSSLVGDVTNSGSTSTYDAAKMLEVINGKKSFFAIDENQNGKAPETSFFRTSATKTSTTQSDSLILLVEPLDAVSEDAKIQIVLNYESESFAQGLHFSVPFDSTNLNLLDVTLDGFISGSTFFYEANDKVRIVLAADAVLPPGPILTMRFNRKKNIEETQFSITDIQVNEYESIPIRLGSLQTQLPTKVGVSIVDNSEIDRPEMLTLFPAYPNPFNPSTTLKFTNPSQQRVTIQVFNMLGQLVKTLLNREIQSGIHQVNFDANGLASGVYIVQLRTNEVNINQRISLLK